MTPRVEHHLSGVSYCWDCGWKLILMDDDTHTSEECREMQGEATR